MSPIYQLLQLPTGEQAQAIRQWLKQQPAPIEKEEWNTSFGPTSLFSAWTSSAIAQRIYQANAAVILQHLADQSQATIVDVGAGDGSLWRKVLPSLPPTLTQLQLVLVDPSADAIDATTQVLDKLIPSTTTATIRGIQSGVEDAKLPACDLVVCSLTLHHLAGADAAERASAGMTGPGKTEVLQRFAHAVNDRNGLILINEADVYCDIGLPVGHPTLEDNLIDSYIRRCTRALLAEDTSQMEPDLRQRRQVMIHKWFLAQPALAHVAMEDRDVYELTVDRWLMLFEAAGLRVQHHQFTDKYRLFHQYQLRAR